MNKKLTPEQLARRAETAREWRIKNPEKSKAIAKRTREKNREEILKRQKKWTDKNKEKHSKDSTNWYKNNKDRVRNSRLKREFGITIKEYDHMFIFQNGGCAICGGGGSDAINKSLAVDHCHKTGAIRGWLCRGCNVGIGNLKDDADLILKALNYIRRHQMTS